MDRRLLILALGMFAMGTDNFVVAGILPGVAASLHTSVSLAGLMVTFYAFTYAVAAPVMAAVAGGWPRKLLLGSGAWHFRRRQCDQCARHRLALGPREPGAGGVRRGAVLPHRTGRCFRACCA